ncbi:uncharacterized protein VTP21DRAFT_10778 [Calcarisporiella thermophila]|uniref:uncharacterized protein n=1 Tax=Calcarisporiella thermophila TaxID=911321 RepID=UPI0037443886
MTYNRSSELAECQTQACASISTRSDRDKPARVAYLGPPGTNTHQVAMKLNGEHIAVESIEAVFDAVTNSQAEYGVVPVENSTYGSVVQTLDKFVECENVKAVAEVCMRIHHYLLSKHSSLQDISKVYSHPQALGQCKEWLNTHLERAERANTFSTAEAAKLASLEEGTAAICSKVCMELYPLNIVASNIEDSKNNQTRFLVIQSCSTSIPSPLPPPASSAVKYFIRFTVLHRPGTLCDALQIFKQHDINLTRIDSRPSRLRPWTYVFFVECDGDPSKTELAVQDMLKYCTDVRVVGTYYASDIYDE